MGPPPPQEDFAKVRAVFTLSKLERDEIARAMGLPHSGGPCYESYLTKWKLWRDLHALFRTMYPNESKSTSNARVMGSMKYCNSVAAIGNKVEEEITKFLGARNRAKQKAQLAEQLAVREAEEKAAAEKAKQLEAQKAQKEKEREQVANQRTTVATMGRVTRTKSDAIRLKKAEELKRKEEEVAEVQRAIDKANAEAESRRLERERLQLERKQLEAKEKAARNGRKKNKRNDTSRLDLDPSPRKKANKDTSWDPPQRSKNGGYSRPGAFLEGF